LPAWKRTRCGGAALNRVPGSRPKWRGALAGVRPQLAVLSLVTSGPLILLLLAGAFAERGRTVERWLRKSAQG